MPYRTGFWIDPSDPSVGPDPKEDFRRHVVHIVREHINLPICAWTPHPGWVYQQIGDRAEWSRVTCYSCITFQ